MSYHHLTMEERNVIYRMRFQGHSDAEIARCLGCHRSTIGRECQRNADAQGRYYAGTAQTWAHVRQRGELEVSGTNGVKISRAIAGRDSGDIYEQAVVKTVAGFFRGNSTHLFGITRFGAPGIFIRAGSSHHNEVGGLSPHERSPAR
jgi:hypothetical protein